MPSQAASDGADTPTARFVIHTDGSSFTDPQRGLEVGGWGWTRADGAEACGYAADANTNRMELTAAIRALEALPCTTLASCPACGAAKPAAAEASPCASCGLTRTPRVREEGATALLVSDSAYVVDGVNGAPRHCHADLWAVMQPLLARHRVEARWVRGHSGDPDNERADALARRGLRQGLAALGGDRGAPRVPCVFTDASATSR